MSRSSLHELASLFLRLGATTFGGPAAHIAVMEREVVQARQWLSSEEFLDLLGACNLMPGPTSTELAIHIGHKRAGVMGMCVAGGCFILPAALITGSLAWAYQRFGGLPQARGLLYGVKPVIIAVVLQAILSLAPRAIRTRGQGLLAAVVCVLTLLGVDELLVLVLAGMVTLAQHLHSQPPSSNRLSSLPSPWLLLGAAAPVGVVPFSLLGLFLFFLKVGAVLFGSGYVLLAFLRADLVEHWGWLTESQLLDAIAVGQFTPGPVFTTATFIGYLLAGIPGAALATIGIFLPGFLFVGMSGTVIARVRASATAGAFLDGVNVGSVALMVAVTLELARAALVDGWTVLLALSSAALLVRYRLNSAWLVLVGAALGALLG